MPTTRMLLFRLHSLVSNLSVHFHLHRLILLGWQYCYMVATFILIITGLGYVSIDGVRFTTFLN